MGERPPGPMCSTRLGADWIDQGTMCVQRSDAPKPMGMKSRAAFGPEYGDVYFYSPAFKVVIDVPFSIAPHMTWDAFWRRIYDRMSEGLQQQANLLLTRGNVSPYEAKPLVEARDQLVLRIRNRQSPFGRLYSEILKPKDSLKSFEQLVREKGSIEAVLRSVGKTRQVVDRIAVVARVAGPATIILEIALTAIVIEQASPKDRGRISAREIGGTVGSLGGGVGGAWAGCAGAAALVSPSLVVPIIGGVSTGGACVVGGILGGMGVGFLGRKVGEAAGERVYHLYTEVSEFTWIKR